MQGWVDPNLAGVQWHYAGRRHEHASAICRQLVDLRFPAYASVDFCTRRLARRSANAVAGACSRRRTGRRADGAVLRTLRSTLNGAICKRRAISGSIVWCSASRSPSAPCLRSDRRPLGAGYRDLALYVEFALVLAAAARHSPALSYLNALLKCMDTLSALAHAVPAGHCAHAARLIDVERALVERCARHAGVMP